MSKLLISVCLIVLSLASVSCLYGPKSKVQQLTQKNFQELVLNSKQLWFVEFFAPWCGHCKSLAPEYEKAAKVLEGIVNVGAVDMTAEQSVGQPYGIQGFPTIKFFGLNKKSPQDYQGGRTAADIIKFAQDQVKQVINQRQSGKGGSGSSSGSSSGGDSGSQHKQDYSEITDKDVIVLTDANFDEEVLGSSDAWLVEFYAPWCGHCKNLQPEWNQLATKLKQTHPDIRIAKVDATAEKSIASRFQVQGYPTIKFFPPGKKSDSSAVPYEGGRDFGSLEKYAIEQNAKYKPAQFEQLVDQKIFDKFCKNNRGACIITFVPHILDSSVSERKQYLQLMQNVAEKFKTQPVTFLWSQGGDQYELEESLAVSSGYPAVIAISYSKKVYSVMRGAYLQSTVETYISGLISGRESVLPIRKDIPNITKVKVWDENDVQVQQDKTDL